MESNTDESNGIRFTWNSFPSNRIDSGKIVIPVGFHYNPNLKSESIQVLEYDAVHCSQCKSVLNPNFQVNYKTKVWECAFCKTKMPFKSNYAEFISETNLPVELLPESTTVEYKLNKKEGNWPIFLFLIDTAVEEDELNELKDSIQLCLSNLPQECLIGIISFGNMCNVHEIGFSEFPISFTFKGDKIYKSIEIQEQLGLINVNINSNMNSHINKSNIGATITQNTGSYRFIVPLKDCEFSVNTFLDELQPDPWGKKTGERHARCSGLALHVAVSLLECVSHGDPSRIMLFLGGAPSVGLGQIIGKPLVETIRNYVDFEKGNTNTKYFKPACEFYDQIAIRAQKAGQIIDVFSCSLNQVGLFEMRGCVEKTGGYMILTDSFSTMQFKDSFKKMFELDEFGFLKMNFKAKLEIHATNPVKLSGGIGHLVSLEINAADVSDIKIGEGGTRAWSLGGTDINSTYTFILDMNNTTPTVAPKFAYIQILTSFIAGDRSHRLRVTTVVKKIIPDLNSPSNKNEISQSFDQEAASVLMTRMCVLKGYTEESREILKWVDKSLIKFMQKFSNFSKDDVRSFKLSPTFYYFPQFMFYLRRSHFILNFNASPDEVTFYKTTVMHETVVNATIMIQPILFAYSPEKPEPTPVFLDIDSMKNDNVLLLDAFFFVVVWHGQDVCSWRDSGIQNNPEYENIKMMLDNPQEYAQSIIVDRLPVPRFVSCDSGSGQERLVKCTVNPSTGSKNKVVEDGFFSDDVSLKVFMEFLVKLTVSN
jgi:protein transport protein SEC23